MLKKIFLTIVIIALQSGCEERSKTDVAEVHWDRDMCARCVMVVSDRHNSVQVREPKTGKTYIFDDIGCMVLWFKKNNFPWQKQATIWVNDVETGQWIDAKTAIYTSGNTTPMAFGFSAHKSKESLKKEEKALTFEEISKRILERKR
jgi:nitrous oxide reductase accessory protein NosL